MAVEDEGTTWVLRAEVVRWGIARLAKKRAHPFFLAYLHVRGRAVEQGRDTDIRADWNELGQYLEVPGGPPRKPFYRPLFDPPGNPSRYWLNENLAGSFAPSSLREGMPPLQVVEKAARGRLSLRPNHAELAREHLLYGERLDIYPFVAFLYRDFGVVMSDPRPTSEALVEIFMGDWHFVTPASSPGDFATLFETEASYDADDCDWFEEFSAEQGEVAD